MIVGNVRKRIEKENLLSKHMGKPHFKKRIPTDVILNSMTIEIHHQHCIGPLHQSPKFTNGITFHLILDLACLFLLIRKTHKWRSQRCHKGIMAFGYECISCFYHPLSEMHTSDNSDLHEQIVTQFKKTVAKTGSARLERHHLGKGWFMEGKP
ncbi:MAG: hypothetical protein PeribacterA2_1081 [Candidatus Peribacter riflensis]|uniref:Transposase n=1 Tax=Candidatus Peribacter riflensis TaxID=1735162 RepID=A0A0S1SJG0_9BACT|nr:MAG: hypothetical protein PeribacterA2_1081 [Candidatus Peribacter riflensis]ALM11540.1 MAG: hypothetical protein PeribacterB2_1083 [Candidatus Peribacter riflensis]ALM12642.1 MAG: hypothetical protein PeribacterC2_1082 [Candidatus Peribacter riflensis]ALM13743.1 MAG: hypothetical protein PeribacterD1_1081 [Candidatus Peribacter riflensis]ALM14846.1 MAG: hypothetical protein PeribacterD2_1083 [Candidatus Peribacter riflensis]